MSFTSSTLLRGIGCRGSIRTSRSFNPIARRTAISRTPLAATRGYATEPQKGRSNTLIYAALGLGAVSLFAYAYTRPGDNETKEGVRDIVKAVHDLSPAAYQRVYNDVAKMLESNEGYDDGSYGPVLVRLAWHTSGTFDKETKTGGSNGATMRFAPEANHGANAGLIHARDEMEKIKLKHPGISYSDLWTLAGVCAIQEMGGPTIPWRPGREDRGVEHVSPDGRLPDGDKGSDHIRKIFYRMGFNDQEIVALSGAHALGRCHKDRSGFDGPWTHSPTSFTNDYFVRLFEDQWKPRKWDGPKQYQDENTKSIMMLETDMALVRDKSFRKFAELYAKDEGKFFSDFAKAFQTLLELGVPTEQLKEAIMFKSTES